MKRLLIVTVVALAGCRQASVITPTPSGLVTERIQISLNAVASSVPVGSCKWRTAEVKAYWLAKGVIPNIVTLSDGVHKVYIEAVYTDPSITWAMFEVADYPAPWCAY